MSKNDRLAGTRISRHLSVPVLRDGWRKLPHLKRNGLRAFGLERRAANAKVTALAFSGCTITGRVETNIFSTPSH